MLLRDELNLPCSVMGDVFFRGRSKLSVTDGAHREIYG